MGALKVQRRQFLKLGLASSGALLVGFQLGGCGANTSLPNANETDLTPNAFIQIKPDGRVILQLNKAEMGQGVAEGFVTLIAEEMKLSPSQVDVEMAQFHPDLKDPEMAMMLVGGSSSMRVFWEPLRDAAARTRELLRQAAARDWGLDPAQVSIARGEISGAGRRGHFGEFIQTARSLAIPDSATLTPPEEFRLIGRERSRHDAPGKVDGSARFGIDIQHADALNAVVVSCPHFGGTVARVDDAAALASAGVFSVELLPDGVAVLADTYWHARKAASTLDIQWDKGPAAGLDSRALHRQQQTLIEGDEFYRAQETGSAVQDSSATVLDLEYHVPFLAHAAMEPMNALVWVQPERVDVWSGVQGVDMAMAGVASALKRPMQEVHIHNQFLGGGFGRRMMPDCCVQAALLSQRSGRPVKLTWSREDDTRHDFYRPMSTIRYRVKLLDGSPLSVEGRVACPGVMGALVPAMADAMVPDWVPESLIHWGADLVAGRDPSATEGLIKLPYRIPHYLIDYARHDSPVPVGFWRSVGHSQNAFFTESLVDEMAHSSGQDPLAYRQQLIGDSAPRWSRVLDLVAAAAQWGQTTPGKHQGLAIHESFQTVVAQVVELTMDEGKLRISRIIAAVDCGTAVNPEMVRCQIEGGIIFALTAALYGEIQIEDGAVVQSNFHDYPLLRLHETPEIEVHIVESSDNPTGIGEPGVPPLAPALANAMYAATGRRQRSLPLSLQAHNQSG